MYDEDKINLFYVPQCKILKIKIKLDVLMMPKMQIRFHFLLHET